MNDSEKDIKQLMDELVKNTHQIDSLMAENLRIMAFIESKIKEEGGK